MQLKLDFSKQTFHSSTPKFLILVGMCQSLKILGGGVRPPPFDTCLISISQTKGGYLLICLALQHLPK